MSAPGGFVALTLGEPAGIAPEITVKAWTELRENGPAFALIGDRDLMAQRCVALGTPEPVVINAMNEASGVFQDALPVLHQPLPKPSTPGEPDPDNAKAVLDSIKTAASLALNGDALGVTTNPIAKSVMYAHGFVFPGHTEYLAHLSEKADWTEPRGPVMMLAGGGLRTALVTVHMSLAEAAHSITQSRIKKVVRVVNDALQRDFGIPKPRLAMAGLNPHAGESGALGEDEIKVINPAAKALREEGIDISDARSGDTLFHEEARAGYDAAICMFHDQGLIPVKTLDFHGGVNVTLGLPFVRTSPDHGSAFDIAGTGKAHAGSLVAAIRMAAQMGARRRTA